MHRRRELLEWLNPALDPGIAEGAGALVDAVAASLAATGPTRLLDAPPPIVFDPEQAGAYRPEPVDVTPGPTSGVDDVSDRVLAPSVTTVDALDGLLWRPPHELAALVRSGAVPARRLAEGFEQRIAAWQPVLEAFARVTLDPHDARDDPHGALAGVPLGVQDMIGTAGVATEAGSRILRGHVPDRDATAWRLLAEQGAVLAGKLSTQEFAAGTTGENDWNGPMRNPWDLTRTAGGAAGGAGAAVAAGLVPAAVATDPGGSIRVPAALCGVVGLKPTFGAMDRAGSIPLTWTTETLGVLARTVAGAAAVADVLLDGRSERRHGSRCLPAALRGSRGGGVPWRIGVPTKWLAMGLDPEVDRAYRAALDELVRLGARLVEIDPPSAADIAPVHRAVAFSEASSIHEEFIQTRAEEYGAGIRERQEAGRGVLASEYLKAFRLRGEFIRGFAEIWRSVDLMVVPTSPVPAARIGTGWVDTGPRGAEPAHTVYTRYSAPMNTLGLPALSVPCGFTGDGLPIGLQISGPPHSEPALFFAGAAYESATPWHLAHPTLVPEPHRENA